MSYGQNARTRPGPPSDRALDVVYGLGWFSIGLGLAEVMAPGRLARFLGMEDSEPILRAYGLREILTGIGILSASDPTPMIWGRVGGDALDLATLATGARRDNPKRENVWMAIAAVAGVTAVDLLCAQRLHSSRRPQLLPDYSDRSGMPRPPNAMRGAASDFEMPRDMRTPEALRPYGSEGAPTG